MPDKQIITVFKRNLFQLEGVVEGLAPFHPRLGQYMKQRLDEMHRAIYEAEDTEDLRRAKQSDVRPSFGPELLKHEPWPEEDKIFSKLGDPDYPVADRLTHVTASNGYQPRRAGRPKMNQEEVKQKRREYARKYYREVIKPQRKGAQ